MINPTRCLQATTLIHAETIYMCIQEDANNIVCCCGVDVNKTVVRVIKNAWDENNCRQ